MKRIFLSLLVLAVTASAQQNYPRKFYVEDRFANLPRDASSPIDQPDGDSAQQRKSINDFPPERRDLFRLMDQVMTKVWKNTKGEELTLSIDRDERVWKNKNGEEWRAKVGENVPAGIIETRELRPLEFKPGYYGNPHSELDQRAIYGRNTWLLWCGGNEDFWGEYLAQNSYAILDFLKAVDSRKRSSRLRDLGLINQPGLEGTDHPGPYGLYIDRVVRRLGEEGEYSPFAGEEPYRSYKKGPDDLETDGVDPNVYGYPSGVIGLRLFKNPKFDAKARDWWNPKAFYDDPAYAADPRTVRPLLVGMTCAICHIAPHPLNLPINPEEPKWENLSSIAGNQYFRPSATFATRLQPGSFLWHYVASQQPGTIDTSMVSTDWINNSNTMNAVFELPARQQRAMLNPPEEMSPVAQTMDGIGKEQRLIARVLMSGEDSIGLPAALARVYINIGLYHDEWARSTNLLIGMAPVRPMKIETCRRNSVYWRVNENFRMGFLQDFFTWTKNDGVTGELQQSSTQGMRLSDVMVREAGKPPQPFRESKANQFAKYQWTDEAAARGARVFTANCMICHSSKQPDGFAIDFKHVPPSPTTEWSKVKSNPSLLTLPFSFEHWGEFKQSEAYREYLKRASAISGNGDPALTKAFLSNNFLSTDLRIPVSLTETNAGRAMATNAVAGQVFAEFSSETYKNLPAVGELKVWNPFAGKEEKWNTKGGGRGYYRVPSLVSLWATAPYLHNNALGEYIPDSQLNLRISLEGRLQMFDDSIRKLLWKDKRRLTPSGEGGYRDPSPAIWHGADPGWIYRTDVDSDFAFPRGHLRHLVVGVLPGFVPKFLVPVVLCLLDHPWIAPLVLGLIGLALGFFWRRGFFLFSVITGVLLIIALLATGVNHLLPSLVWLLPIGLIFGGLFWIMRWQAPTPSPRAKLKWRLLRFGYTLLRWSSVVAFVLWLAFLYGGLWAARSLVNGDLGDLRLGPMPKRLPVNAIMNLDPDSSIFKKLACARGLLKTVAELKKDNIRPPGKRMSEAERLAVFNRYAGPALWQASKCRDYILDRGHYFGESLSDAEKEDLIAFLKTL